MPGVSAQQLLALLAKGKPVPGILLLGSEAYLRELCRRKIIDAYVAEGVRDWGVTRFSAEDDELSAILGQAQTLPMLAPQQVIFVSDVDAWERLGEDSRESPAAARAFFTASSRSKSSASGASPRLSRVRSSRVRSAVKCRASSALSPLRASRKNADVPSRERSSSPASHKTLRCRDTRGWL